MQAIYAVEEVSEKYTRPRLSHTCTHIDDHDSTVKTIKWGSQVKSKRLLPVRNQIGQVNLSGASLEAL